MNGQVVKIIQPQNFSKRAKKLLTEIEIKLLAEFLSEQPEKGDVIPGTGGLRKLRWSLGNQGKRGGSRVIYYYHRPEYLVLLLAIYAKSQKEDLDADEKKALRSAVEMYIGME